MAVEVVALIASSADILIRWEVRGTLADSTSWQELERRLARELCERRASALEIYFLYPGPPFENYDRRLISGLLAASQQHAPGARTYAVLGPHAAPGAGSPFDLFNLDAVSSWYLAAFGAGLTDVLELPLDPREGSASIVLLRLACARSEARESALRDYSPKPDRWSAVLAERAPDASAPFVGILDPYVRYGVSEGSREPVVVVVQSLEPQGQSALVDRVLDEHRPDRAIVALLHSEPTNELKALCQRCGLRNLVFRGLFELRYFLLRLNARSDMADQRVPPERLANFADSLGTGMPPFGVNPPVETRHQRLPLDELESRAFEFLCVTWVSLQQDVFDVHLYGAPGDGQKGIDFVATHQRNGRQEIRVYQCKRHKKFEVSELKKAIELITYPADVKVILLSCEAKVGLRDLAEEREVLLWDGLDISRKLKPYPNLVEDFFGIAWRNAFNGPSA